MVLPSNSQTGSRDLSPFSEGRGMRQLFPSSSAVLGRECSWWWQAIFNQALKKLQNNKRGNRKPAIEKSQEEVEHGVDNYASKTALDTITVANSLEVVTNLTKKRTRRVIVQPSQLKLCIGYTHPWAKMTRRLWMSLYATFMRTEQGRKQQICWAKAEHRVLPCTAPAFDSHELVKGNQQLCKPDVNTEHKWGDPAGKT